jgi:uncharacterized cupin superfamily protein
MTEGGLFVCQDPCMTDTNIWDDVWGDQEEDWSGGGGLAKRLVPRGPFLGMSLYELGPGNFQIFHFHHGTEELLVVLRGRPTLRTYEGSRQLDEGAVVHFPPGPGGAHEIRNETAEAVRYVMAGTRPSPEVVEYPDLKKLTAQSRLDSQTGEPLFVIHDVGEGKVPE